MAEVMNELSPSNGEADEENDEIKLNGDACEDVSSINKSCHSVDEPVPLVTKEKCLKKKLSGGAEIVSLDGLDINASLIIANGRIKNPSDSDVRTKTDGELANSVNAKLVSGDNGHDPNTDDDSSNEDGDGVSKCDNEAETVAGRQSNASGEESGKHENQDCGSENEDDVSLNLSRSDDDGLGKSGGDDDACSNKSDASKDTCASSKTTNEQASNDDDDVISISSTPDKGKKPGKKLSTSLTNITPRRSSRNLNKQKSYAEKDAAEFEENSTTISLVGKKRGAEDDEIEEVTPTDPLADEPRGSKMRNKTIVVSDTKGLVEFASNAKASRSNKKEPTLVIIDTNSILSGRGPVPVSQQSSGAGSMLHSSSSAPIPVSLPIPAGAFANATRGGAPSSTSAFSVIPIGLPAQGMYSQFKNPPPQMKPIVVGPASTSVTPVSLPSVANSSVSATTITTVTPATSTKQPPVILPSLTDDMFVVEAPSFIVPYVYEKPPMKSLKEHIEKIEVDIKEAEEKERQELVEKERKELVEKERKELEDKERDAKPDGESEANHTKPSEAEEKDDPEKHPNEDDPKKDPAPEKETNDSKMEVDEENSSKTTAADTDATKKTAEPEKKDESVGKEVDKKSASVTIDDAKKPISYFDNPLGKFFMQIGLNLVQEHVQTDLLRSQKRKRDKEGSRCSQDVHSAIDELTKTLESSKENNDPFKLELKKCELCSFKTESLLVMAHHLETPHMKNYTYRCNFCPLEVRSPHDILFHMEAEHNIRGRLERAPAFHQCPNCPFEDNQKGKLTRHLISCSKKYRPERNQEPPLDWEPPAKIPRVTRNRPPSMSPGNAVYQAAMSGLKQVPQNTLLPKLMPNTNMKHNMLNANKRPNLGATFVNRFPNAGTQPNFRPPISVQASSQGMMYRPGGNNSQTQVLLPQGYQLSGAQIYQQSQNAKLQSQQQGSAAAKLLNQPSISITPLPRQTPSTQASTSNNSSNSAKPGKPTNSPANKGTFVVCEICDGYIKDLEQLRNHMQWIHKVKIHPKMIYNRPPLNCQKCQFRFFTDQGLERHLLGSHGLVTSSMQEAANKGKDGGRCPVCGRVYQWKLLNHVARDHQMALKPAHLSYKCTVCTATFGMYKQFESHVYSAHSVVAKRAMDTSKKPSTSAQNDALLKPLKINDEITIIPQPVRAPRPSNRPANATTITATVTNSKGKNDKDDQSCECACVMEDFSSNEEYRRHVCEKHLKPFKIQISRIDLESFNKIPDKENTFKLTKGVIVADELKSKFNLRDFFIAIKRHPLEADYRYKIIDKKDLKATYCPPEVVYSDVDGDETENQRSVMSNNTLFAKRMMERSKIANDKITTDEVNGIRPNDSNEDTITVDLTESISKPKRKPWNGVRKTKRPRKRAESSSDSEYSPTGTDDSSDEDDRGRENIADNSHFMLGSKTFAQYAQACQRKSISSFTVNQPSSRLVCVSRTVTTSRTTKMSQMNYPRSNFVPNSSSSFTLINRQTVTTSNRTTFGAMGPRPLAGPRNVRPSNTFAAFNNNAIHSVLSSSSGHMIRPKNAPHVVRQSIKVIQRSTSIAASPQPKPASVQKPNEVISLLSESDSDESAVEIVELDANADNSEEVYILPT